MTWQYGYTFCETIAASLKHIRQLTDAGRKLGGGADSPTLCGTKPAWDLKLDATIETVAGAKQETRNGMRLCRGCAAAFEGLARSGANG